MYGETNSCDSLRYNVLTPSPQYLQVMHVMDFFNSSENWSLRPSNQIEIYIDIGYYREIEGKNRRERLEISLRKWEISR